MNEPSAEASEQEDWRNVEQIHELVKQEGDARCERAFDFLLEKYRNAVRALAEKDAAVVRLLNHLEATHGLVLHELQSGRSRLSRAEAELVAAAAERNFGDERIVHMSQQVLALKVDLAAMRGELAQITADVEEVARMPELQLGERRTWKAVAAQLRALLVHPEVQRLW